MTNNNKADEFISSINKIFFSDNPDEVMVSVDFAVKFLENMGYSRVIKINLLSDKTMRKTVPSFAK